MKKDTRATIKVYEENEQRLKNVAEAMEQRTKMKHSFHAVANAAIALGLLELEKQNGVK